MSEDEQKKGTLLLEHQERQKIIEEYKNAVDPKLLEFVCKHINGENKNQFTMHEIGSVSEKKKHELEGLLGFNLTGYRNVITADIVRHIERRHGKSGTHDRRMTDMSHIARAQYILDNYDSIDVAKGKSDRFFNSDGNPATVLICRKRVNGTILIVETVPDSQKKQMVINSMFFEEITVKKEKTVAELLSIVEEDARHDAEPRANARNERVNSSTISIPHSQKKVNSFLKQNKKEKEIDDDEQER